MKRILSLMLAAVLAGTMVQRECVTIWNGFIRSRRSVRRRWG